MSEPIRSLPDQSAATPGHVSLTVERDGGIIWGGVLWSRKYNSTDKTIDITAKTWESVFDQVPMLTDMIYQNQDQLVTFKSLIDKMQLQDGNNFGFDTSQIGTCGVQQTVLYPGYEYHMFSEAVNQLVSADNGFDYTIDVGTSGVADQPYKLVRVGYPQMGLQSTPVVYDYPGNISSYDYLETAIGGGVKFAGLGSGSGNQVIRSEAVAADAIASGYPSWWVVQSNPNYAFMDQIQKYVQSMRNRYKIPVVTPSFTFKSDRIPPFEQWGSLGDYMNVYIEDARFPDGKTITSRMIGWNLNMLGQDEQETLTFVLEGDASA